MMREGIKVTFKSLFSPKYPDSVIVPSAITLAKVPASVESNPPLYVPRESLDDMTRESSDKFTPGLVPIHVKEAKKTWSKYKLLSFPTCKIYKTSSDVLFRSVAANYLQGLQQIQR